MRIEQTVNQQTISFILFCISGIFSGIIYDIYRTVMYELFGCKHNRCGDIIISVIILSFLLSAFMFISELDLKIYYFAGIILGIIIYFNAASPYIMPIFEKNFKFFKKIFNFLLYPVKFSCIIVSVLCKYAFKLCLYVSIPAKRIIDKKKHSVKHLRIRLKKI